MSIDASSTTTVLLDTPAVEQPDPEPWQLLCLASADLGSERLDHG